MIRAGIVKDIVREDGEELERLTRRYNVRITSHYNR